MDSVPRQAWNWLTVRRGPLQTVTLLEENTGQLVLQLPEPNAALRHAVPIMFEAVLAPIAIFYCALLIAGFRGALIGALCWSAIALARRLSRGERASTLLILGAFLLALRTAVSFITGSALIYFVQPMVGTVVIAGVLIVSAIRRRPFTQRFAIDFCPFAPEILKRPRVQQFFVRISVMWAAVLLVNTGLVLWLLLSSSLKIFVLERTGVTWMLTAGAIFCSIFGFTTTMRKDGISVRWGRWHQPVFETD